jgi:hypothetical protein
MAKENPRKYWKTISEKYKKQSPTSNKLKVDELFNHFKHLYGEESNTSQFNENVHISDDFLDKDISYEEIRNAVFSQNNNRSSGPDELCAEIFKCSFDKISNVLYVLFNRLFHNGEYPESWGDGIIVPVFKGGNIDDPNKYRGICLINIIAKVYSQILLNRLTKWSQMNEKLNDNQFGFQKKKSTTDCIFLLQAIITKTLSSKKKLYAAFVDYEKCFDKLERALIWQKLFSEHISTKFIQALRGMYSVVKQCIRFKQQKSDFYQNHIGVKQGDPSSSLIFLFFVNDIVINLQSDAEGIFSVEELQIFILLFADDSVLFAQTPDALQILLNKLEVYCTDWGLKINTDKTKIMIFEKGRHTNFDFTICNRNIEVVKNFKYLGIMFYKNGSWARTQQYIARHSYYALHNLFIIFNTMELTIYDKCHLFDSLVGSVLNYGAAVWGYHKSDSVEIIHRKFMRKVLGVKKSTNVDALYGELGRYPMKIYRQLLMVKYWLQLLKSENVLIKNVYKMLSQDANNGNSYNGLNWAFQIKSILYNIGMPHVWLNQNSENISYNYIKQRLLDIYKQTWHSNISDSSRLSSYSSFKQVFECEKYLDCLPAKKFQIALTRFRVSSHKLAIETGRYSNIDRQQRKCLQCNMNVIESEFHFLLVCPKYRDLRIKYFSPYFCRWPNLHKFKTIMSTKLPNKLLNLSKFIYYAFQQRTEIT